MVSKSPVHLTSLAASATALSAILALGACQKPKGDTDTQGAVDTAQVAKEAFVYGLPMVMNYGSMYELNIDKTSSQYKGPINQISVSLSVFTPADTA